MRKLTCYLAVLFLLFQSMSAFAESMVIDESSDIAQESTVLSPAEIALLGRPKTDQPTHLTVGNPTMVSGSFFTDMWGNNTSDIDVRTLLHGYNTVEWSSQLQFVIDPIVVSNLTTGRSGRNALYTITLQQDLTYCDGTTPITAKDYVFSLLLCTSPQAAALGAESSRYSQIVGYDEYHSGEAKALRGVRLIDEYTFSIAVKAEYEPFFYDLANLWCIPYPRSVLAPYCDVEDTEKGAQLRNIDPANAEVPFTVELLKQTIFDETQGYMYFPRLTSGPYQLKAYDRASGNVDFAINPYYKGNYEGVKPVIDTLTLVPVVPETMIAMLQDGQVDLINKCVDGSLILQGIALRDAGFEARNYARLGYAYCALACEKGPQQFTAVRQALAYCIDKDAFVNDFLQGFGIAVHGYYGMGQWMLLAALGSLRPDGASDKDLAAWDKLTLDGLNPYPRDLTEAKKLLVKNGWTLNAKGKKFVEGVDDIRYKKVDGQLMRLSIRFAQAQNSVGAQMVSQQLAEAWPQIGGELIVEEVP
ncbi:MAG TPA: ABC transporter substrate-binding protein, partial [Candidatus Limiplasma sp.]|nr:ABC transporter substrate-binding protein [Candidatus Limiplasma sp.]